jgi:hypothetical protein
VLAQGKIFNKFNPNNSPLKMKNQALICILITVSVFGSSCKGKRNHAIHPESQTEYKEPEVMQDVQKSKVQDEQHPILIDVHSLIGKNIDQIREVLGPPLDEEHEPSELQLQTGFDEWSNIFQENGQELLVTFNPTDRQVVDFFLPGEDLDLLMKNGNLKSTFAYSIETVKQIKDRSKITGVKVIPRRGSN